jgi:hypothetical protein
MELRKLPEPFNPKDKPIAVNPTAADLRGQSESIKLGIPWAQTYPKDM